MSFVSTGKKSVGSGEPAITTPPIAGESGGIGTGSADGKVLTADEVAPPPPTNDENKYKGGGAGDWSKSGPGNGKVLVNRFGDPLRDEKGRVVYEMPEEKRLSREEMQQALDAQRKKLVSAQDALERWDEQDKAQFKNAFGVTDDISKKKNTECDREGARTE